MSSVTIAYDSLDDIRQMIDSMVEKDTFRGRQDKPLEEQKKDWLVGFASQRALTQFFEQTYDVPASIDTRAYDDVSADSGDIKTIAQTIAEKCEVKKTKTHSKHVAITSSEMRLIDEGEPIIYVLTDWDGSFQKNIKFEIVGWCKPDALSITKQGETPWTASEDNWCQPLSQMRSSEEDWHELIDYLSRGEADPSPRFDFSA